MLASLLEFALRLWTTAGAALGLSPDMVAQTTAYRAGDLVIVTIAVLAGGSQLAGQSVILFVNRVRPGRFGFSLLLSGVVFALGLALWALMAWLCAVLIFGIHPSLLTAMRIAGLSSAPLLLGFLIFIPYLGAPIDWALRSWGGLIALAAVRVSFGLEIGPALACAAIGWLLVQALTRLLGRPLAALRDRLWRVATGAAFDADEQELIDQATAALRARLADWEGDSPAARR